MNNAKLREELMQAMFKIRNIKMMFHSDVDNSMSDLVALSVIARNEKMEDSNFYFSDIQRFLKISKPAVSQIITSLEKKELITREIDNNDRRKFIVRLTKKGHKEMAEMHKESAKMFSEVINRFGEDETKELIRLLNKLSDIAENVKEENCYKE